MSLELTIHVLYSIVQYTLFICVMILLLRRQKFKPIVYRSKYFVTSFYFYLQIHLSFEMFFTSDEYSKLDVVTRFILVSGASMIVKHTHLVRAFQLYIKHLFETQATLKKTGKEKWYVRYNLGNKGSFIFSFHWVTFSLSLLPFCVCYFLEPADQKNIHRAFPKIQYFYYSWNVLYFLFFLLIAFKIYKLNDALFIKSDMIITALILFSETTIRAITRIYENNVLITDSVVFLSVILVTIFSFILPIIKTFEQERIMIENLRQKRPLCQRLALTLKDPDLRGKFEKQLISEFAVENLMFYTAVEEYVKIHSEIENEEKRELADNIYHKFIEPYSDYQINLSSDMIREIKGRLESLEEDIFSNAADEILNLMAVNSFQLFEIKHCV